MGLQEKLQTKLAKAFDGKLADAVSAFAGTYQGAGVYDPVTEETTAVTVTYTGRGVLAKYETRRIDNINILSGDLQLVALTNEVTDRPAEGHTVTVTDLADRTKSVSYLVKGVQVDPASATYQIQLRR
ncbi:glutamate 5-kinase [Pseudomonas fitomaticsae]|uniref:Glutamate 5-kinase n=1 Tax=Pseudomonas fitomaticsae TaxID=2837969 RepID=A0ABY3Q9I5_9PSED|nr:glutamate 5-kinase [Pseudomonas fitomaticsae]UFQ02254.1 glutamate 5-kinase [Pseudomonas fitomaticsae]